MINLQDEKNNLYDEKEQELDICNQLIKDSLADTMDSYGVTRSAGQIYATLYLNGEPMTLDELQEELGMSKGSMSLGVRKLIDEKIIHRVYRKGSRKSLFQAEMDFFQFFVSFFTRRWQREVNVNMQGIRRATPRYQALIDDPDTPEEIRTEAQHKLNKITESLEYYTFLELLVDKFQSGELFKYLLDDDEKNK